MKLIDLLDTLIRHAMGDQDSSPDRKNVLGYRSVRQDEKQESFSRFECIFFSVLLYAGGLTAACVTLSEFVGANRAATFGEQIVYAIKPAVFCAAFTIPATRLWLRARKRTKMRRATGQPAADLEVFFDSDSIHIQQRVPYAPDWVEHIPWNSITRVCILQRNNEYLDEIRIFTQDRQEAHIIPREHEDASNLWKEIRRRGLFHPDRIVESPDGDSLLLCCDREPGQARKNDALQEK